jgi:formylglycine-generating enzyme required for sulfatase activity
MISGCSVFKKNPSKGNPPGTLKINDTLYIDQTEVANVHWREFLYYVNRFDSANVYKVLPDTLVWRDSITYSEPLVEYYFRHPSFNNYPAVGISYEQAIKFCKWRTFVVNLGMYMDENKLKNFEDYLNDSFPIKLYYRLPTKQEWEMVASGKLPVQEFPYGYKDVYTKWKDKKVRMFNCLFPGDRPSIDSINDARFTQDIKAHYPNSYGTYNMIGNLAEMVSEKGIAKGGSFAHPLDSCKIFLDQHYERPESWLGFRCVAVKLK